MITTIAQSTSEENVRLYIKYIPHHKCLGIKCKSTHVCKLLDLPNLVFIVNLVHAASEAFTSFA